MQSGSKKVSLLEWVIIEQKLSERDNLSIDGEMNIENQGKPQQHNFSARLFQTDGLLAAKLLLKCNLD